MNLQQSIAIIGAGPSGLAAADALRQLGYQRVTVFEQNARVGGKVYSVPTPAGVVELGAVLASAECDLVLGLARRLGVAFAPYPVDQHFLDEQGRRHDAAGFLASRYNTVEIGCAIACYAAALARFAAADSDDMGQLPDDLSLPFDQFAAKYGFTPVAELARGALIGFGYGYYETVPALYFMKLIGWLFKPDGAGGLKPGEFFMFPQGFQSLWEALAREHDVRLNADVSALRRDAVTKQVQLTINGGEPQAFDAAIVATPLQAVDRFVSLTRAEVDVLRHVRSNRYIVSAFAATGLKTGEFLFLHENEFPARIGHMNAWANRNPALPMYLGWQLADWPATAAQLKLMLASDIEAQGGRLEKVALRQEWDYFPHVGQAALQQGFFARMAALQGEGGVYYVGGALNFETVEHSARQAQALVRRHFGPPAA
jgi:oxygen-dependent protoporphyrinogen oxidase